MGRDQTFGRHVWEFKARFRRNAFGWRSQPAIQRIKQAVAEIRRVARSDPTLGAEGAILFIERVSPALEHVDGSSGAIGSTVDQAIEALVPLIANAPVDARTRATWLERLFEAYQNDEVPYLESLGDHWGALCASKETASRWADELLAPTRSAWSRDAKRLDAYFKGATNCCSALLAAERYAELLELLELDRLKMWHYRQFGVRALVAQGRKSDALRYAEAGAGLRNAPTVAIARVCEEILLSSGLAEEAYQRHAIEANRAGTYLGWFRAIAKKYPHKPAEVILADLVARTPGDEGKWFAAAKDAGLFDTAIALARRNPCSPQTLTRAARDFADTRPAFAVDAGLAALHWLAAGYGYEVTTLDVLDAWSHTLRAARNAGRVDEVTRAVRELVAGQKPNSFMAVALAPHLTPT